MKKANQTLTIGEACGILEAIHCIDDGIDGIEGNKTIRWLLNSIHYKRLESSISSDNVEVEFCTKNGKWERSTLKHMVKDRLNNYDL